MGPMGSLPSTVLPSQVYRPCLIGYSTKVPGNIVTCQTTPQSGKVEIKHHRTIPRNMVHWVPVRKQMRRRRLKRRLLEVFCTIDPCAARFLVAKCAVAACSQH